MEWVRWACAEHPNDITLGHRPNLTQHGIRTEQRTFLKNNVPRNLERSSEPRTTLGILTLRGRSTVQDTQSRDSNPPINVHVLRYSVYNYSSTYHEHPPLGLLSRLPRPDQIYIRKTQKQQRLGNLLLRSRT